METTRTFITVEAAINSTIEKIWDNWTNTKHIIMWNNASDDWHTTKAENDLKVGGKFLSRMEAKDGSFGFDFEGVYTFVKINERIDYTMADDRKASVSFTSENNIVKVIETFEAETINEIEMQKIGWQSILNNFKKYCESK